MAGEEVYVVGGGNSAGQAALHLARYARQVTLLVRGPSLAASMSEYLIAQLEATRNVAIRYRTAVLGGREEDGCLAGLDAGRPTTAAEREEVPAGGLFVLIGSVPRTSWLPDEVERDAGRASSAPGRGHRRGRHQRLPWRPACRVSSRSATSAPGRSSGSPPPSGTAPR